MQSIEHEERKDLRNSLYIQIIHSHWTWEGGKPKSSRFPPPGLGDYLGRGTNEHMKACSGSMLIFFLRGRLGKTSSILNVTSETYGELKPRMHESVG